MGRLLRRRAQSRRAGDGGGPRRPDPARRRHRRLCSAGSTSSTSDLDDCGTSPSPSRCSRSSAPGLGSEFPPLKTLDATPGNLRPPTTSFVGRESEIGDLQTVLKAHRLVTLTGVGGVGKTRLALEVAAVSSHDFPDGVWVIELAAVGDPAAVPEAVAAVLGITQQPGMSLAASVAAALEGRSRLLVFDNCEHVLDAAADIIEAILAESSTVKILATSREGLRLPDEQIWPVASLDVRTSAVTLFVDRAHAVAPGNSVNDEPAQSPRSAAASTGSRWRSSSPHRGCSP